MSQVLLLLRGIPASGKSTFAKKWVSENPNDRVRVNRDDLRYSLYGQYELDFSLEKTINLAEEALINSLLARGKSVVIDNQNLKAKFVTPYLAIAARYNVAVIHKDFPVELEEALHRNSLRDRKVPEDVIRKNFMKFTPSNVFPSLPTLTSTVEFFSPLPGKPKAYIFDLDGTLALLNRSPFNWSEVINDAPNGNVVNILRELKKAGYLIVITSGRSDISKKDTIFWLDFHEIPYDFLFMRKEGDSRKDAIVKLELFDSHIRNSFNIVGVFDDRLSVARLWHSLGLTLFRVGDPDASF